MGRDVWETGQIEGMAGGQRAEGRMNENRQLGKHMVLALWKQRQADLLVWDWPDLSRKF